MKVTIKIELDCENPNNCQIPQSILLKLLEDIVTERHVLIYEDEGEWQLFINSYNLTIKDIDEFR
jgi:hypothetical protein